METDDRDVAAAAQTPLPGRAAPHLWKGLKRLSAACAHRAWWVAALVAHVMEAVLSVLLGHVPMAITRVVYPVLFDGWGWLTGVAGRWWPLPRVVRWCEGAARTTGGWLAPRVLRDPRDAPLLHAYIWPSLVLLPSAVILFAREFSMLHAAGHLLLILGPRNWMFQLVFSSLHQVSHRPAGTFKARMKSSTATFPG